MADYIIIQVSYSAYNRGPRHCHFPCASTVILPALHNRPSGPGVLIVAYAPPERVERYFYLVWRSADEAATEPVPGEDRAERLGGP
jgi:uncharacterized protein YceH (UPF0502 family)